MLLHMAREDVMRELSLLREYSNILMNNEIVTVYAIEEKEKNGAALLAVIS